MPDIDALFGQRVKAARKAQGRSQDTLSGLVLSGSHMNITQITISRIENGGQGASLAQAVALADALGLSLANLLEGAEPTEGDLRVANLNLLAENARLTAGLWKAAQVATSTISGRAS